VGFLREVVSEIREELRRPGYPGDFSAAPEHRAVSLRLAIERDASSGALLVEFKRRSPGAADPELPTRSAREFVDATSPARVTAYSCIATRPRFGGSVADVAALAESTERPILFKDFVIDVAQVDAARAAGASAILLIARLAEEGLLETSLAELAHAAHDRGVEVLLELHAKAELRHVAGVAPDVTGVNVRDLDTLRIEPEVAAATIRAASALRPLLGLSGIASPGDAQRFWSLGVDGVLVGSAVARSADPAEFLRSLRRPGESS
jgi:indole-3-glycerol phosphate synthase